MAHAFRLDGAARAVASSAAALSLVAATAGTAATYIQSAGGPGNQVSTIDTTPTTYTVVDGAATAISTTSAAAGGSAFASVISTAPFNSGSAGATVQYGITLLGPAGAPVSVQIVASGFTQGTAAANDFYTAMIFLSLNNAGGTLFANADAKLGGGMQLLALNTSVLFAPNVEYFFQMGANAGCGVSTSCSAQAFIDPIFTINAADASRYTLVGIPSVTATPGGVPEPASWALLITGFPLVGQAARTRRRRAA